MPEMRRPKGDVIMGEPGNVSMEKGPLEMLLKLLTGDSRGSDIILPAEFSRPMDKMSQGFEILKKLGTKR